LYQFDRLYKCNSGSGMIMILAIVPIILIGFLGLSTLILQTVRTQQQSNLKVSLTMVRQGLIVNLSNDIAWTKTKQFIASDGNLTTAANFDCFYLNQDCFNKEGDIGVLLDAANNIVLDSRNGVGGINERGEVCQTYANLGSRKSCPFRYTIHWKAQCSASCTNPKIDIRATVTVSDSSEHNVAIDLEPYLVFYSRDF